MISKNKDSLFTKYDNFHHIYCENCGHSIHLLKKKTIRCSYCGHLVYPTKDIEFKEKLLKEMKKHELFLWNR